MKKSFLPFLILGLSLVSISASHALDLSKASTEIPQGGITPGWMKDCIFSNVGYENCSLIVRMTLSPNSPCSTNPLCVEYCVKLIVDCPADIPPGDIEEHCESGEDCEICCDSYKKVQLVCDGQTFTAAPGGGSGWQGVAIDCQRLFVDVR